MRVLVPGPASFFVCAVCLLSHAQPAPPVYFSQPGVDAPELATLGKYAVGVRTVDLVNPGQIDILNFNKETGQAPRYDRPLKVEVWYPAVVPQGSEARTTYDFRLPSRPGAPPAAVIPLPGLALRDAAPVRNESFPLVVVSHGYPGSRLLLTYLTENLASKGYIVAAIDHTDSVFGEIRGFPSTLLNRAADQLFTIKALTERTRANGDFLNGILDASRVAIVGYSMGGYGALANAGAGYSRKSALMQMVPGGYLEPWTTGNAEFEARRPVNLKAVVALAPWGAQPPINSWDDAGLAGIRIPSLFIVGDQDDISLFEQGVRRVFDGAVNSERCMLVYENARHNVGANPPPPGVPLDFRTRESFDEPVWRKDRIAAINQHFITAFLDLYLKGDVSRRSYLHPGATRSNDGAWPPKPGEQAGSKFSDGAAGYWKGFQRRYAVGLQMHCREVK